MSKEFKNIDELYKAELGQMSAKAPASVKAGIDSALGFNQKRGGYWWLILPVVLAAVIIPFAMMNWDGAEGDISQNDQTITDGNNLNADNNADTDISNQDGVQDNNTQNGTQNNDATNTYGDQSNSNGNGSIDSDGTDLSSKGGSSTNTYIGRDQNGGTQSGSNNNGPGNNGGSGTDGGIYVAGGDFNGTSEDLGNNTEDSGESYTTGGIKPLVDPNLNGDTGSNTGNMNDSGTSSEGGTSTIGGTVDANNGDGMGTAGTDSGSTSTDEGSSNSGNDVSSTGATDTGTNENDTNTSNISLKDTTTLTDNASVDSTSEVSGPDTEVPPIPEADLTPPPEKFKAWMITAYAGGTFKNSNITTMDDTADAFYGNAVDDKASVGFGLSVNYRLKNGIMFGSGVGHSAFKENFTYQKSQTVVVDSTTMWNVFITDSIVDSMMNVTYIYDSTYTSTPVYGQQELFNQSGTNSRTYLHIPLRFGYQLAVGDKWRFDFILQGRFNLLLKSTSTYVVNDQLITTNNGAFSESYLDLELGTNVHFNVWKNLYLTGVMKYRPPMQRAYYTPTIQNRYQSLYLGLGLSVNL